MALQLSARGAKTESDIGTGKPAKGRYLMMVKGVDETMEKKDQVVVDFEVLAGTTPDQRGKVLTEYFTVSPKAIPRLTRLAMCLGLLNANEEKDVSFSPAVGRCLFVEVEDHKYKKEGETEFTESVRVAFSGMWSLGNPDVADLLQVPDIANMINTLRGGSPQPTTPVVTPAATGDKGKWGSIL